MLSRNISLSLFLLFAVALSAQTNTPFDKEHFPDADGLKKALASIKQGNALFEKGGSFYQDAFKNYEEAYAFNPNNSELATRMGVCQLNGPTRTKALPFFQQALALDPTAPRIHFLLGYSYQLNALWDMAIAEFQVQREITRHTPDEDRTYNMADKHIAECNNGKAFMASPVRAKVTDLGEVVNGPSEDYGALVSADGGQLYFTSRRSNTTGGRLNKLTNDYFEDVYASTRTVNGWSAPEPMRTPVNSEVNDASIALYNDGRSMIIYRDQQGAGDLYETKRTGDTWEDPRPFGANINTEYQETSACYSFDKQWLYFVSDREGGLGGLDIYRSKWDAAANDWAAAENLGPTINSPFDEDGVFFHGDGKSLYFASKGHNSMGGFDIFQSTLTDAGWSAPENLGWPINSPDDDLFFLLSPDGMTGYLNSVRPEGLGNTDIYRVDMLPIIQADESAMLVSAGGSIPTIESANKAGAVLVRGTIKGIVSMKGIEADIDMMDLQDAKLVAKFSSDENNGNFMVVVPGGREYAMNVHAKGYLLYSQTVAVPEAGGSVDLNVDIKMQPLTSGSAGVMNNIFFDHNKATLTKRSLAELGQVAAMLKENPNVRVEIGGHTDSDGTNKYNMGLSDRRARAVVARLVKEGIAKDRLVAKGYGETKPAVPNTDIKSKAQNRRTELTVL